MLDLSVKTKIVQDARGILMERFPLVVATQGGSCLFSAIATIGAARKHGVKMVLQAGSARWPRVTPETDDGVEPNVFAYEFEPNFATAALVSRGMMPEMHVWAGITETQEVVDITTKDLPEMCSRLLGKSWKAPEPPDYFWGTYQELPPLAGYFATREATMLALELLKASVTDNPEAIILVTGT